MAISPELLEILRCPKCKSEVEIKEDKSQVTQADIAVNTFIHAELTKHYDVPIVSEEMKLPEHVDDTKDVIDIISNEGTFSALRADGSVVVWGNNAYGGDSSSVQYELSGLDDSVDIVSVYATNDAFSALRADGL